MRIGRVPTGHALDGRFQMIETVFLDQRGQFRAVAAGARRFMHDHAASGLLHRTHHRRDVERHEIDRARRGALGQIFIPQPVERQPDLGTRQTGKLIFAGIASGILLSQLLTRLMAHLLFGVVQLDTNVWFVLTLILLATAFLAAYLPAVRATRIDPVTALRHD